MKSITHNKHLVLILVALVFVVIRIPYLDTLLFWDEIGVYGRGIYYMLDGTVSMHPSALDPVISRGHPLLFTYLYAAVARMVGEDIVVLRSLSLLFSFLLLLTPLLFVRERGWRWSVVCTVLIGVQPILAAQSIAVLPELLVTLLSIVLIWAYLGRRLILYFLVGSALVLIKETAIIIVGGICFFDFVGRIRSRMDGLWWGPTLWATPIIALVGFLLVQKGAHGWYFFPYHAQGFILDMGSMYKKLSNYLEFIFLAQGRFLVTLLLVMSLFVSYRKKLHLTKMEKLLFTLSAFYLLFHTSTFYLNRYVLVVIVMMMMASASIILRTVSNWGINNWLVTAVMVMIVAVQSIYHNSQRFSYDEDFSFVKFTKTQKEVMDYIVSGHYVEQKSLFVFPLIFALEDRRYGYCDSDLDDVLSYSVKNNPTNIFKIMPMSYDVVVDTTQYSLAKTWTCYDTEFQHWQRR